MPVSTPLGGVIPINTEPGGKVPVRMPPGGGELVNPVPDGVVLIKNGTKRRSTSKYDTRCMVPVCMEPEHRVPVSTVHDDRVPGSYQAVGK